LYSSAHRGFGNGSMGGATSAILSGSFLCQPDDVVGNICRASCSTDGIPALEISDPTRSRFYLGKYQRGFLRGEGTQAKVFRCSDEATKEEVAIKVFDRARRRAPTTYAQEVAMLKMCEKGSPNLLPMLDSFEDGNSLCIVFPLYAGHLLGALKVASPSNDERRVSAGLEDFVVRSLILQVHDAVSFLHSKCILHRDVKAQNILVDRADITEETTVILCDLGLAVELPCGEMLNKTAGTRKYWAPELFKKKYWHAVDIFALGVLTYLLIIGHYPFANEDATIHLDLFDRSLSSIVSAEALLFLRCVLEKNPKKRESAVELEKNAWIAFGSVSRKSEISSSTTTTDVPSEYSERAIA